MGNKLMRVMRIGKTEHARWTTRFQGEYSGQGYAPPSSTFSISAEDGQETVRIEMSRDVALAFADYIRTNTGGK